MKLNREKIINLVVFIAAGVILFTPLGFPVKVFVNKLISFAPSEVSKEDQLQLTDYNWKLSSSDHKSLNLSAYKNRVIVINFWATWCPPCVAEMPSFQDLYTDYSDKVVFLFVAHDEKEAVATFFNKKGYELPVYFEMSASPAVFETKSIPKTFVIGKNGNIIVAKTGVANWNSDEFRKILDTLILEQP
jgi:thiol-disulfide isomerase/thioredoxin